jgi:hypothetical protein
MWAAQGTEVSGTARNLDAGFSPSDSFIFPMNTHGRNRTHLDLVDKKVRKR